MGRTRAKQVRAGANGQDFNGRCRITSVDKNSPAAKAGLKVGDVVTRVEGREVKTAASLERWVAEATPGETLILQVDRGGRVIALKVKLQSPKHQT